MRRRLANRQTLRTGVTLGAGRTMTVCGPDTKAFDTSFTNHGTVVWSGGYACLSDVQLINAPGSSRNSPLPCVSSRNTAQAARSRTPGLCGRRRVASSTSSGCDHDQQFSGDPFWQSRHRLSELRRRRCWRGGDQSLSRRTLASGTTVTDAGTFFSMVPQRTQLR